MSDIPTLVALIDARLDALGIEITALEDARAALQARALTVPEPAVTDDSATRRRPRRRTPQTPNPAPTPNPPATSPTPELAAAAVTGSSPADSTPRRRAGATATANTQSVSSLSAEQLERLLADASSGLSAGAIAQRAGVDYRSALTQLRALVASGTVRRTGSGRSTLWRWITDENRVAQRAAELERLIGARREDRSQRRGRARAS